jgi:hypothetical protein
VLRAGIAAILQDYDKGIAILREAEVRREELASVQQSADLKLPSIVPFDPSQSESQQPVPEMKEEDRLFAKLDNAKRRDYSYRQLMAACLVDFNLLFSAPSLLLRSTTTSRSSTATRPTTPWRGSTSRRPVTEWSLF